MSNAADYTSPNGRQRLETGFQYCPAPQFSGTGATGGLHVLATGSHQSPFWQSSGAGAGG
ncbi:MAG: hypothetical protein KDB44_10325 [Mycobacterium sp.]|nr:hypothetical protein [Mycobacterium sp.]